MPGSCRYHSDVMSGSRDGFTVKSSPSFAISIITSTSSSVRTRNVDGPVCPLTRPRIHTRLLSGSHTSISPPEPAAAGSSIVAEAADLVSFIGVLSAVETSVLTGVTVGVAGTTVGVGIGALDTARAAPILAWESNGRA
eukprot:scaffold174432_cov30-Tisochrysis_lutea.AAC.4